MAKGNFPLRLSFIGEVEEWAKGRDMSINAAIAFMCREYLDRERYSVAKLQGENARLLSIIEKLTEREG